MPVLNQKQELAKKADLLTKQDILTPGTGITIQNNVISATGTGGSTVSVTPILSTGTRIAAMEVDGTIYTLFAPTPPSVGVTQVIDQGVELARVTINGVATSIYAPESSTVLSGTSAPSSSLGEDNNLYVQYTVENETYTVDMTYVKLNGEWVELSTGGGGTTIPEHWTWTTNNLKAYLLAAPNEYGWAVGTNTYYFDSAKTWTIYNREFSRGDNSPVLLAGIYHDNRWFGTAAISTNQEATYFSYNEQGFGPYSYKGYDWYISGGNYSMEYGNYNGIAYYGAVTGGGFNSDEQRLNIIKAIVDASDLNPISDDFTAIVRDDANIMLAAGGEEDDYSDATFKVMRNGDIIGNAFHGATTLANGTVGLVPAPLIADKDKFLKGDGTWAEGGGGNANQEELTWDEYEALTEEEKTNGTVYYITDADEIEPDKFRPVIYSEDEREIGVWTDGKPLYQKTYIVNNISADTEIDLNIPNIEKVINQWGTWDRTNGINNGPWTYDLNAVNETSFATNFIVLCRVKIGPNKLYIGYPSTAAYGTISEIRCTIQYTKTTDFPGSGKWTPQGVPAKHYSTDEHVIGTWVNGSTIYEKTFVLTSSLTITTEWINTGFYISDAEKIVSCEVIRIDSRGSWCLHSGISPTQQIQLSSYGMTTISLSEGSTITLRYTKSTS